MSKIIRLTESDLARIVRRVISEQLVDPIKLGFAKWGDKGYIIRLPQGSTPQNDSIRITAEPTGNDNFLVGVVVNGNKKIRSEMTKGLTTFENVESTLGSPFKRMDDRFVTTSGKINGEQLVKLVNMLKSLKIDDKNNMFLNESKLSHIVRRVMNEQMEGGTDPQDPKSHFDTVIKALSSKGFKKDDSMLRTMGVTTLTNSKNVDGSKGVVVRYINPAHEYSKKAGYLIQIIVNGNVVKTWKPGNVNMYEVVKQVENYLTPKQTNESRIVRRVISEGMGQGNFKVGKVFDEVHNRQYIMSYSSNGGGRNYNDFEFSKPKVVSVDKDSITLKISSGYYNPNDAWKEGQKYVNLSDFCLVVPYSNIQEVRENQLMIAINNDMLEYRIDKGCTSYKAKLAEKTAKAKSGGGQPNGVVVKSRDLKPHKQAKECLELNNKISDVIDGLVKNNTLQAPKGTRNNEDPYSYVELFNGKFCITKTQPSDGTYNNWIEVTDSKQKMAVLNKLKQGHFYEK